MYKFNVNADMRRIIEDCLARLAALGIPVSPSIFFTECKGKSRYGWCSEGKRYSSPAKNIFRYVVAINVYIEREEDVREVVFHELLHTVDGAFDHGAKWKSLAAAVNGALGTNIKRVGKHKLKPEAYRKKKKRRAKRRIIFRYVYKN